MGHERVFFLTLRARWVASIIPYSFFFFFSVYTHMLSQVLIVWYAFEGGGVAREKGFFYLIDQGIRTNSIHYLEGGGSRHGTGQVSYG